MALSPRLELKHSQTLVMTPQLQQAIKLLQYNNLELGDFVSQEVEKNPLLEFGDDNAPVEGEPAPEAAVADASLQRTDTRLNSDTGGDASGPLDTDFENVFNNDGPSDGIVPSGLSLNGGSPMGSSYSGSDFDFEQNHSVAATLRDHLEAQLPLAQFSPPDELIAHFLIDMLDEGGYLRDELSVVAEKLGCGDEDVERVLQVVQGFDPIGVFARDLGECLALQLKDRNRFDPAMETFVHNLELLGRHEFDALRRVCDVDSEDLTEMVEEIRSLNPRPGFAFGGVEAQTVVADVFVRRSARDGWLIEVNSDTLPRVLVNTVYHAEIAGRTRGREDRSYINECLASANWLVKALDQRARTILKVATELVRQQEGFFLRGVKHLRPLNLRAIAEAIDMHESTVSRVTANKYLSCERGIFEMKYFFTSAIAASGDGESHAAESVKQRIRELIDAESPKSVLSDDKLVDILRREGIEIARRTVAKYRESLHISSSVQRRREKRVAG
ncbi:MAG: RNA polymerase factor sigma-54 [Sphingomonadales bacterium]